jgi:hypothetical protein
LWRGVGRGAEKDVGGDSFSAIFLKGSGNGWIAAGPVGHEKCDISFTECGFDFGARKCESFVDLAGEAPSGSEIDKDGPASGELAGDFGFGPGEAIGGGCGEGGGGGSFEKEGGQEAGEESEGDAEESERARRRKGTLGLTVEKESEGEAKKSEKYGQDGGGSAEAESNPEKPKNGGEHGEGENLF